MRQSIEFFYDFRSPYSYMAFTQLTGMDADIALRPIRVLKLMELVGNVPTTITCKAKGAYARADLARWGQRYGVPLNPSEMRANDGDACSRAVLAAQSPADAATITLALYRAIWSEGETLATADDILAVIAAAGIDAGPVASRIDTPEVAAQLDANTAEAAERGVFGTPTIFVGDAMFFGNDRLDFVREELARQEDAA
ncbi:MULTISPECIES: 2-hydroxychromene-2-carboxylate isomerase [unclassified Paracoccus (in: a-proteobacteria)]|uniref:2-hydroxychromene-2-carboxylate isomerase n=1 Tax=unclassified Paracoccus (in: a-proteobacteria) TaxID=2688777 RepID=UPI001602B715|nr:MULTISPECIES: 2-hydroxychromene-2-carboxylate isomerase [unclassified Paracoccus (in: a-proteobacteria)]MBB1493272.1 2-hydroxychromene-2-carboxylate isomerase [Paracoccus sp. MC1854]MBB1499737.1 2-hydroxychromene-2-carboxylate isomerase [Paracoccus sp. MC1862]QQO45000.1 2-hydroxychromene-2-carboxylate isomerase [Paracoccus sp. MC1862]